MHGHSESIAVRHALTQKQQHNNNTVKDIADETHELEYTKKRTNHAMISAIIVVSVTVAQLVYLMFVFHE